MKKYESSALVSSSSSSEQVQQKFHVFLSFRGEDTRNNFTSHLHRALKQKGIDAYVDDRLEKGEKIETLFKVIQESTISIIVLSKDYASSSWCLDELCKILECKRTMGQKVVPIFYHVDPSDVRYQKGSFEEAFAKHQRFKDRKDKLKSWRAALVEVADLAGHHLRNDRLESEAVEEIAEVILEKLKCESFVDTKPLVGIDSHVKEIESLLCFDSEDVRIIGIWGMGGIGKTTIAEAVFNRFIHKFEGYCFLNVRTGSRGEQVHLQQKLVSKILGDKNINVDTTSLDASIIDRFQRKKVFIVLDDVNDSKSELLDLSFINFGIKFGPGSKIIVTSRDKQLLRPIVRDMYMYEVRRLIDYEALQLFSWYAFSQKDPKEDFVKLSKKVVHFAKGVPLVLRVVGSSLRGKSTCDWEGHLNELEKYTDLKIENILKISYHGLRCDAEKHIFLDIACLYRGMRRDDVENILGDCLTTSVSFVRSIINSLVDKSLITISNNRLEMHDLLQQMAWNIVRQESKTSGKRSRLWTLEDICPVLKNNTGTESVKGMILDMSKLRERVSICPTAFARMYNLKFLKFYNSHPERKAKLLLENDLVSLPGFLSYLQWDEYPSKSLPSNFHPEYLIELKMPNSHVEQLWEGVQDLAKLKHLDLSSSHHLTKLPDLSKAANLVKINLESCEKLENFQGSVGWRSLKDLYLTDCSKITKLSEIPENLVTLCLGGTAIEEVSSSIGHLRSLSHLDLGLCSKITKFPEIPENLEELSLFDTAIEEVPSSIERASRLEFLYLSNNKRLKRLSSSICKLKYLKTLNLYGCLKLESFPEILETMESLIDLYLGRTSIEELPSSIENLVHLSMLTLDYCGKLKNLPSSIRELKSLKHFSLICCSNVTKIPEIPLNLSRLNLRSNSIEQLPSSIGKLLLLDELDLSYCERLQSLPSELPPNLQYLDAHGCISLEEVPSAFPIGPYKKQMFKFTNCLKLDQNCINWVKTPLSIQQKASEDVKPYPEKVKLYHEEVKYFHEIFELDQKDDDEDYDEDCIMMSYFLRHKPSSSLCICFPGSGSEIPQWFSCKSQGSSVTIQLPSDLDVDNKFVGLAVCVVLACRDSFRIYDSFRVSCRYKFNTNGDHILDLLPSKDPQCIDFNSDTVLISYNLDFYSIWYKEKSKHHLIEASFEFFVPDSVFHNLSNYFVVKECGVCLLYAQDDLPVLPHQIQ